MKSVTIASDFKTDFVATENLIYSISKYTNFKKVNIISNSTNYKQRLVKLCNNLGINCKFYTVKNWKIISKFWDIKRSDELKHIPIFVYVKMWIPQIIKYEKTLYLDTDTLFINKFDTKEIADYEEPLYVVNNGSHAPEYWFEQYSSFMEDEEEVSKLAFNAGVIFYNMGRSKYSWYLKKIKRSVKYNRFKYLDQAHLNNVYKNNVKFLDTKYNYPVHNDHKEIVNKTKNPVILHFASKAKPWKKQDLIPDWNSGAIKWHEKWLKNNENLVKFKKDNKIDIKLITYGTFDLLHIGHLNILEKCKSASDYLVVGLSTDSFNKKKGKISMQSYEERKEALLATGIVDEVIPEENWDQKKNDIINHEIDIFAMGSDWKGKFNYLKKYVKVIHFKRTKGISSTKIRKGIKKNEK